MSKIDILKQQFPQFNLSIIDVIKLLDPSDKNTYCDLIFKSIKSRFESYSEESYSEMKYELANLNYDDEKIDKFTNFELHSLRMCYNFFINSNDLIILNKFHNLRKKGIIGPVDLTKIKSFDDLLPIINVSELKKIDKDLEKHVHKVYEDDQWLLVRPLTYESSLKYGSNTKWCTTYHDDNHFERYTDRGILIYIINKKTGLKVGCFYSLSEHDPEFSFWDQKDRRIDSLESDVPQEITSKILSEVKNNRKTNKQLISDELKEMILIKKAKELIDMETKVRPINSPRPIRSVAIPIMEPREQPEVFQEENDNINIIRFNDRNSTWTANEPIWDDSDYPSTMDDSILN